MLTLLSVSQTQGEITLLHSEAPGGGAPMGLGLGLECRCNSSLSAVAAEAVATAAHTNTAANEAKDEFADTT
jgi:hypothetical protein